MNIFSKFIVAGLFFIVPFLIYAEENRYSIPVGDSPVRGPENAPVTIIEFIDYQ